MNLVNANQKLKEQHTTSAKHKKNLRIQGIDDMPMTPILTILPREIKRLSKQPKKTEEEFKELEDSAKRHLCPPDPTAPEAGSIVDDPEAKWEEHWGPLYCPICEMMITNHDTWRVHIVNRVHTHRMESRGLTLPIVPTMVNPIVERM